MGLQYERPRVNWTIKGQPWRMELISSLRHSGLNISRENNDFGFNSSKKNQPFKKIPI